MEWALLPVLEHLVQRSGHVVHAHRNPFSVHWIAEHAGWCLRSNQWSAVDAAPCNSLGMHSIDTSWRRRGNEGNTTKAVDHHGLPLPTTHSVEVSHRVLALHFMVTLNAHISRSSRSVAFG